MNESRARADFSGSTPGRQGFSQYAVVWPGHGTAHTSHDQVVEDDSTERRRARKGHHTNVVRRHTTAPSAYPVEARARWLRTQCAIAEALAVSRAELAVNATTTTV